MGKVYSWGRGTFGRLGSGSEEDRYFPARVTFFGSDDEREDKLKIVGMAAGAYHSLAFAGKTSSRLLGWLLGLITVLPLQMMDQCGPGVTTPVSFITTLSEQECASCNLSIFHLQFVIFCLQTFSREIKTFLDPDMDGQIGVSGENYSTPRLLEGFLELGSPSYSTQDSEMKIEKPPQISSVKVGGMMSLAIDDLGALWI